MWNILLLIDIYYSTIFLIIILRRILNYFYVINYLFFNKTYFL